MANGQLFRYEEVGENVYETPILLFTMTLRDLAKTEVFKVEAKHMYNAIIGDVSIKANGEICYEVDSAYSGARYGTHILEFAKEYASKKSLTPFLRIRKDNIASQKVAKRNHFCVVSSEGKYEVWKCLGEPS